VELWRRPKLTAELLAYVEAMEELRRRSRSGPVLEKTSGNGTPVRPTGARRDELVASRGWARPRTGASGFPGARSRRLGPGKPGTYDAAYRAVRSTGMSVATGTAPNMSSRVGGGEVFGQLL